MTNPIFEDLAAYKQTKARSDLRYTVQDHKFKMVKLLAKMRKRQTWLVNAAHKLRLNDSSSAPALRITQYADDIGRELQSIQVHLDKLQRELGDPTT